MVESTQEWIVMKPQAGGRRSKGIEPACQAKPHKHNVRMLRRSTVWNPVSWQWFVKMKLLAEPAIEAVRNGTIKFVPERFSRFISTDGTYRIGISRQLVNMIPAYCDDCGD